MSQLPTQNRDLEYGDDSHPMNGDSPSSDHYEPPVLVLSLWGIALDSRAWFSVPLGQYTPSLEEKLLEDLPIVLSIRGPTSSSTWLWLRYLSQQWC